MHLNAGVLWTVLYYELTLLYLPYKESSTRHLNVIYHIRIKWKREISHILISFHQKKNDGAKLTIQKPKSAIKLTEYSQLDPNKSQRGLESS